MKALVVGLGSIGTRHVRVLGVLGLEVETVSRRGLGDHVTVNDALTSGSHFDYLVIATETHLHTQALQDAADSGYFGRILVEKPLGHEPLEAAELAGLGSVYVGYNLRFHRCLLLLKDWLNRKEAISIQVRAGQHISQWRPGRDPEATASAVPGSGGVLRDLSHELDYLLWLFGPWSRVVAQHRLVESLGIGSDALYVILLRFDSGAIASVELNYLDTQPRRRITVTTSEGEAELDLIGDTISLDGVTESFDGERDDTYRLMHQAHLDDSLDERRCSAAQGNAVTELIEAIEHSSRNQEWVTR